MAQRSPKKKSGAGKNHLFDLVRQLHAYPNKKSVLRRVSRSSDPLVKRAFRIDRHLRALEDDILELFGQGCVSLNPDPSSDRIVLSIRNDEWRCSRFAYLSRDELKLLLEDPFVAEELRTCPEVEDVA